MEPACRWVTVIVRDLLLRGHPDQRWKVQATLNQSTRHTVSFALSSPPLFRPRGSPIRYSTCGSGDAEAKRQASHSITGVSTTCHSGGVNFPLTTFRGCLYNLHSGGVHMETQARHSLLKPLTVITHTLSLHYEALHNLILNHSSIVIWTTSEVRSTTPI